MPDLSQLYGNDLATVDTTILGQQRVLRRLLTNPGDYLWNASYGAGLAQFVGQPASAGRIRSVIRSQIFQEAVVARTPEPVIDVQVSPGGTVTALVSYADSTTGETQVLSFSVGEV
jgi:hypothetical protein